MHKPTKDEILQALDDLDEGKPITADLRVAVNQYQRHRVEAHLEQEVNAEAARELETTIFVKARYDEFNLLTMKKRDKGLTPCESDRLERLWWFDRSRCQ